MTRKRPASRRRAWRAAGFAVALAITLGMTRMGSLGLAMDADTELTAQERTLNVDSFELAWVMIRDRHWDANLGGLNWEAVHDEIQPKVEEARTPQAYMDAMESMIDRFGQSHFAIVSRVVYDDLLAPAGERAVDGTTGVDVRGIAGAALVTKVEEGSPAEALEVKTGWKILSIDGENVDAILARVEERFKDKRWIDLIRHAVISRRLAGTVGTTRDVSFEDGSGQEVKLEIALVMQEGTATRLGYLPVFRVRFKARRLKGDIGYIAFNAFMDPEHVMSAFSEAVQSFMDCRGIVIDIRGNGGGMPLIAMGMAGWLIDRPGDYFGTMKTRDTSLRFVVNPRLDTYTAPVAVLIDGSSVSCAEIFAGGLRDMGRARLFGTRTAGMVLPAQFMKLPNGDFFLYPVADYFSRNGDRLEGVGVAPDENAPHEREALLSGRDNALEAAMEWINREGTAKRTKKQ